MEEKNNAIEKALRILGSFLPDNKPRGTVEISLRLGFHKATVSRILQTLVAEGYLRQDPENRKFSLGETVVRLGTVAMTSARRGRLVLMRPYLEKLRDRTGQTVTLEVLVGENSMLAFSAESTVNRFLAKPTVELSPHAITTPAEYEKDLILTRERGYSAERGEINIGITALGVPVFGISGQPECGLIIVGPNYDIESNESEYVALLKETAALISREVFFYVMAAA